MSTSQHASKIKHYPSSTQDLAKVDHIRISSAAYKGLTFGPEGRAPYDGVMMNVIAPPEVTYESDVVGGVSGFWCIPANCRDGIGILFLHGGGYTMGSANGYRHFVGHIAKRTEAKVFIADYRLAPEHPFPAALEDAYAAYVGMLTTDIKKIFIIGDSAGGGLSLSLLAHVRTKSETLPIQPTAAVVLSPWTDLSMSGDSITTKADEELYLNKNMLAACANMYLNHENANHPQASVLYGSLEGLPPLQIHVGTSEILLDDAVRYAHRAQAHNDEVSLHLWEGMPHVFQNCIGVLEAAEQSLDVITAFVNEHIQS